MAILRLWMGVVHGLQTDKKQMDGSLCWYAGLLNVPAISDQGKIPDRSTERFIWKRTFI